MDVYTFIRSLTMEEREKLADEIGCAATTLSSRAYDEDRLSVRMAELILNSKFNKKLPDYQQYKEADFRKFHKEKIQQRIA